MIRRFNIALLLACFVLCSCDEIPDELDYGVDNTQ